MQTRLLDSHYKMFIKRFKNTKDKDHQQNKNIAFNTSGGKAGNHLRASATGVASRGISGKTAKAMPAQRATTNSLESATSASRLDTWHVSNCTMRSEHPGMFVGMTCHQCAIGKDVPDKRKTTNTKVTNWD